MENVTSADGTTISFERYGSGTPVLIVGGAFSTAAAGVPLANALAERGLQGVTLDRRGRGESADTSPYSPEREAEDLSAVIAALGGTAAVLGHSSGAVLALVAAGEGVSITHLFLSEPPLRFGVDEPPADLAGRIQALIDDGRPDEAVVLFQREGVGLPDALIEQIRTSPMFESLVAVAQSTVYDTALTAAASTPTAAMAGVGMPVTILRGEPTMPMLVTAAEKLSQLMDAELVIVPESHDHGLDPAGTAREVALRLS